MEIDAVKTVKVNAKTIAVCAKCSDCCSATLKDQDGNTIVDYDGYVPDFFPGEHYGDYIMFNIDIDTGVIANWVVPTKHDIERFIKKAKSEDDDE